MSYTNIVTSLSDEDEAFFAAYENEVNAENKIFMTPFEVEEDVVDVYAEFRGDNSKSRYYETPDTCYQEDELNEFSTFFNVAI